MSALDHGSPFANTPSATATEPNSQIGFLSWLDAMLDRASDRLNPILVKEARQALKSQQFLTTFAFLLFFGWGWSILGIILMLPGVYYSPGGPFMLVGYFIILTIPLLIIVPFSTYRSLAAEREDGTFELLVISSLSSRQIITGKLGSAVLQMLVYYSALSPCIAFTYLLRGVDVFTIGALLIYTFMASLMLSIIGLMVATISRARHWQLLLSVLFLLALVGVTFFWAMPFSFMLAERESLPFDESEFWIANLAILMFYVSYAVLFVLAAAGMISFASDNRATRLRVVMLIQQVLLVGWMSYVYANGAPEEALIVMSFFAGIHWFAMGTLMCGEIAQLSPRVRRSLPQSYLGRMLFTWFNPGSGTGYIFATLNMAAVSVFVVGAMYVAVISGRNTRSSVGNVTECVLAVWAYVTIYLGLTRPLIRLIQPYSSAGLLIPVLINVFVGLLGCFVPLFLDGWFSNFTQLTYTPLQLPNWFWTLEELIDRRATVSLPSLLLLFGTAVVVFIVNLLMTVKEVEAVRTATPLRVLQDDADLNPQLKPPKQPSSPWSEERG